MQRSDIITTNDRNTRRWTAIIFSLFRISHEHGFVRRHVLQLTSAVHEALQPTGTADEQAFKAYVLDKVGALDNFHLQQRAEIKHLGLTVERQKDEIARCYKKLEEVSVRNDEVFNDSMLQAGLEVAQLRETVKEKNPFRFNRHRHHAAIHQFLDKPSTKKLSIQGAQTACD